MIRMSSVRDNGGSTNDAEEPGRVRPAGAPDGGRASRPPGVQDARPPTPVRTADPARSSKEGFRFTSPAEALEALLSKLGPVSSETLGWPDASGRVLAEPLVADRPSPPCDVSAMDGYAVRLADLARGSVDVAGDLLVGQSAPPLPEGKTLRIVTGASIPAGAEAVVKREDVAEHSDHITIGPEAARTQRGQYIRRAGENARAGETIVSAGTVIAPPIMAAMATFGAARVSVYRRVRVGVLVTGDELLPPDGRPEPWQLRDANGPALRAMVAGCPWCELHDCRCIPDEPEAMSAALRELLRDGDAVFITGGVSMGGRDHVPSVVRAAGAEVIFHKLPQRPGKPILAAVAPAGQAILGLPGNPVSVMVTARRFGVPALAKRAGLSDPTPLPPAVTLAHDDGKRLDLWWYRPVRLTAAGLGELLDIRSSGDVAATARSDGFIELPPGEGGPGPWPFYAWQ